MYIPFVKKEFFLIFVICFAYVNGTDPYQSSFQDIFSTLKYAVGEVTRIVYQIGEAFSEGVEENCEFKCPNGRKPKPNPYYQPVGNGCGVAGLQIPKYIPLQRLEDCCNEHDICYGTCLQDIEDCDKAFKKCLYSICSSLEKIITDKSVNKGCKSVAKGFYLAVITGGCKYYLDAQKKACICDVNYYHNEL